MGGGATMATSSSCAPEAAAELPAAFVALEAATRAALDAVGDAVEWGAATRAGVLAWRPGTATRWPCSKVAW